MVSATATNTHQYSVRVRHHLKIFVIGINFVVCRPDGYLSVCYAWNEHIVQYQAVLIVNEQAYRVYNFAITPSVMCTYRV